MVISERASDAGYARWCADVDGAEREKMWEKAGGKTRFAEMKVKREEAKSRAKTKREIATAAEAKRDKEKAVAAQVRTGKTAWYCGRSSCSPNV